MKFSLSSFLSGCPPLTLFSCNLHINYHQSYQSLDYLRIISFQSGDRHKPSALQKCKVNGAFVAPTWRSLFGFCINEWINSSPKHNSLQTLIEAVQWLSLQSWFPACLKKFHSSASLGCTTRHIELPLEFLGAGDSLFKAEIFIIRESNRGRPTRSLA